MRIVFVVALGGLILLFGGVIWFSRLVAIGAVVVVALAAGALYHTYLTAPGCDSGDVTFAVSQDLSSKFPSGAITVRHVRTVTGGFFSSRNACELEASPMAEFGSGTVQNWSRVAYSTSRAKRGGDVKVEVQSVGPLLANSAEKSAD